MKKVTSLMRRLTRKEFDREENTSTSFNPLITGGENSTGLAGERVDLPPVVEERPADAGHAWGDGTPSLLCGSEVFSRRNDLGGIATVAGSEGVVVR